MTIFELSKMTSVETRINKMIFYCFKRFKKKLFEKLKIWKDKAEIRHEFKHSNHWLFGGVHANSIFLVWFQFLRLLPVLRFRRSPVDRSRNCVTHNFCEKLKFNEIPSLFFTLLFSLKQSISWKNLLRIPPSQTQNACIRGFNPFFGFLVSKKQFLVFSISF